MKKDDVAGAEVVGAILLFGLFVGVLVFLNVTAVPAAGLEAEEEHLRGTLSSLNTLQSQAEAGAVVGEAGASVSAALDLGPSRPVAKDFFSFFLADPALSTGELTFVANHGNLTLTHTRAGSPTTLVDMGSLHTRFPVGRLTFDPRPMYREEGHLQLENGALVSAVGGSETVRFPPPVSVQMADGIAHVSVKARILNGTGVHLAGAAPVRITLTSEAATLTTPARPNADQATLRLETAHGRAWGDHLNRTAEAAGLLPGSGFTTRVQHRVGELDIVTWTILGAGPPESNDVRLSFGLAVHRVEVGS